VWIRATATLEKLRKLWDELSPAMQKETEADKDIRKGELSEG
jgi:hypothetical protein